MTRRNLLGGCDPRVNRRSRRRARGVTQQRGCRPQWIDHGPTGQYYHFSHVVPCYRRECVTTGEDPGQEGDPRRGKEEEAVGCQPRCSRTVEADLTMGSGRGKARQKPRSTNTGDGDRVTTFRMPTVPTEQLRRECNTREQGHQGNYLADSPKLVTVC